jgi:hypothetical protein
MLPVTDSFLRLGDFGHEPALGFNLGWGWARDQREYPPVAVHKANQNLMSLHVPDMKSRRREYAPIKDSASRRIHVNVVSFPF